MGTVTDTHLQRETGNYSMGNRSSRVKSKWEEELETEGWIVVPSVLTQTEVETCKSLTWDWLESLGSGIDRSDPTSWTDINWPGDLRSGITGTCGSNQQPSLWFIRGHPKVQEVFARIWSVRTSDLITSMDTILIWRYKAEESQTSPASGLNLHVDQNPFKKRGLHCVQGMIPFLEVTKDIGGLQLVPRSHVEEVQQQIRQENPLKRMSRDFVKVSDAKYQPGAIVVEASAGDLILWDSRVIHGSKVGPTVLEEPKEKGLARCTGLVCMTPRAKARQEVLEKRLKVFRSGSGFTHWPHEAVISSLGNSNGRNITWSPAST